MTPASAATQSFALSLFSVATLLKLVADYIDPSIAPVLPSSPVPSMMTMYRPSQQPLPPPTTMCFDNSSTLATYHASSSASSSSLSSIIIGADDADYFDHGDAFELIVLDREDNSIIVLGVASNGTNHTQQDMCMETPLRCMIAQLLRTIGNILMECVTEAMNWHFTGNILSVIMCLLALLASRFLSRGDSIVVIETNEEGEKKADEKKAAAPSNEFATVYELQVSDGSYCASFHVMDVTKTKSFYLNMEFAFAKLGHVVFVTPVYHKHTKTPMVNQNAQDIPIKGYTRGQVAGVVPLLAPTLNPALVTVYVQHLDVTTTFKVTIFKDCNMGIELHNPKDMCKFIMKPGAWWVNESAPCNGCKWVLKAPW